MTRTRTSSFGTSKREGHDASEFYRRNLYARMPVLRVDLTAPPPAPEPARRVPPRPVEEWADRIYCHTSEAMVHVPDGSVALAFTSPPYNSGKDFDQDADLDAYLGLIARVAAEVYRVLRPGGRYLVNVANLGRKPYIPMHAYFYAVHTAVGFLPAGEIIWRKSKGMNGNCAWGSWRSAQSPVLRDVHEYILVFAKERFQRPDRGDSTISGQEFMEATLSVWDIPPASARKVGHPAPFPVELAERVIRLYSYRGDVVLDPFNGSGATCVAAARNGRRYVGYDISPEYCDLARRYLAEVTPPAAPDETPGTDGPRSRS
ncbi:DNA-methyltransferase [Caldinitratiruptor microaerophilus]|uniref:Methyltransferase n=1 Tax=Caldinitratiruptor microaerophilus TaxID=671077 RepID=A0AA35CP00_9FIRM|nr:site-specific DNA-methyltransferase [Caldinitratiruptor microaerophilus]BDG62038.1 methyltransferase [Caldinitratiruptor microaerophilus]